MLKTFEIEFVEYTCKDGAKLEAPAKLINELNSLVFSQFEFCPSVEIANDLITVLMSFFHLGLISLDLVFRLVDEFTDKAIELCGNSDESRCM